jgi:hypothetical protein
VGDVIEIGLDDIARTITVDLGATLTFTPALTVASTADTLIHNWGPGATDLVVDLHLSPSSPCIDTGDTSALPTDTADLDGDGDTLEVLPHDLGGNTRVVGGDVDMGAYEDQ